MTYMGNQMSDILSQLDALLAERKQCGDGDSSYVASLHERGLNKILEKVGEESTEFILAAKDASEADTAAAVYECADLWFHSLVALSHLGVNSADVQRELAQRFNISGHAEKAARPKK